MNEVLLGLIALAGTAVGVIAWMSKASMRQAAAREIAWREFMSNDQEHHREDMEKIAGYMGAQTAVLQEIREDIRDMRRA